MRHLQILSKPPPDRTIPRSTVPTSLWHGLTPAQRQQLAQGLAELIQRMRQRSPVASTESNHEQL
jgi:hypothetical protein